MITRIFQSKNVSFMLNSIFFPGTLDFRLIDDIIESSI